MSFGYGNSGRDAFNERKERDTKICEEFEKKESEIQWTSENEAKAAEFLKQLRDGSNPPGNTNMEKLVNLAISNYRKSYQDIQPYLTEDEKLEEIQQFAKSSKLVDGKYILTINLGGIIPYELSLFDYVPWDVSSPLFSKFLEFFKRHSETAEALLRDPHLGTVQI